MALRIIRQTSMGTPLGGGSLSVSDDGKICSFNIIERFRHNIGRFSQAMPLSGGETEGDPDSASIIFDPGGTKIEFIIDFFIPYDNDTDADNDYADIDNFFSTIPVLEKLTLEIDEFNWVGSRSREVVLKGVEIVRKAGEKHFIAGRISLYGGKAV